MSNDLHFWNDVEREARAAELRYAALSADWHRLRDIARAWERFQWQTFKFAFIVLALAALFVLAACDTPEKKCTRWEATVEAWEVCALDAGCRGTMGSWDYERVRNARIERARWCRP